MGYFYKECRLLEDKIGLYFDKISEYNQKECGDGLSVILLGSLSRGEGTWIETENGPLMLSDIEYFTVYPDGFTGLSQYTEKLTEIADEVFGKDSSSLFHIDNSMVSLSAMSALERKLLTYDAKQVGKTVVGEDRISLLPEVNLSNINTWDIKDILTHRVFSALYYGLPLKNEKGETEYRYNIAKNSLDLMTVLLVRYGEIESGFIKRLALVKELPVSESIKNYFEFCLSLKLGSQCEHSYDTDEMEKIFISLVKKLKKEFKIKPKNLLVNAKTVSRRALGIVKRAVKNRCFPSFSHLSSLIESFEKGEKLTAKQKKVNLVINGYPVE